jgi:signal transduction histidine kinase/DNA-binding response OmpR family regulator/PAS domain-containing protein
MSIINSLIKKITAKKNTKNSGDSANEVIIPTRRSTIIDALNKSIEIFSANNGEKFDDVMTNGIRPFVDAVGLDRVVFYKMLDIEGGKRLGQIYRWDKSEGGLMSLAEELKILPNHPVLERWLSITSQGGSIRFRKSDYTEDVAALMQYYGVISILIVPIFTRGEFWGVINFQDHTNDRYFDEDCSDLLYSAARTFSSAIIRVEMEYNAQKAIEALKRREKMSDTLNKVAVMFLSQNEETFEETMTAGVKEFANLFQLDRLSIWRNIKKPDAMHASQIYRWDREAGGTTVPTKGLEDVTYAQLAPRWEKLFADGELINSPARLLPEAAMLKSFGCITAFITPIYINNAIWGFALLEDRHNERFFEDDSVEMMRSAILLCANTVIRADMEREISSINEFNRSILDSSPVGATVFDENGSIIDCNDITFKLLETSKEFFMEHFFDFSPEYQDDGRKSTEKGLELIKRVINDGKEIFEWVQRTSKGELVPFEVTLVRAMYKGKYVALGYQYDLRSTKKMMESIREQGEQLKIRLEQQELISELSRGFISSGDSQVLVQEAVAKLGRYHKVSLVFVFAIDYENKDTRLAYHWTYDGKPPRMAIANLYEYLVNIFPITMPDSATMPIVVCDDTSVNLDAVFQALYTIDIMAVIGAPLYVDGHLWGVVCVEQSNTPRKWTDNEKGFVAMTTSTIAGVIMRDIYTEKLKEALSKAMDASKAKSEFLSNMSHEMRTPLNAITGMTVIGKKAKDEERKNYALEKIGEASAHLLGVINDVLDMSKIEANMLELSPIEFNFEKMLQKAVTIINFRADEKKQKLAVHIDSKIPKTLIADDQRLNQVVTNLLSNAVKFTPEHGSITLEARCTEERNDLCTIQISVTDTGIGISAEQQKRLFSSFQQAESSTTRKYGGTGLGLAISKSIVEMMDGKIWVTSETGKGSTFTFNIKAQRGETKEKTGLLAPGVNWKNIRIMVIDDDRDALTYFCDITRGFGVSCDTATSGEEALKLIEKNGSYHIYFVDWRMGGMDGIQLTRELKTQAGENSVVIMISAAEWSVVAEDAKKANVDKFLSKPLFPSTVVDIINECIGVEEQTNKETQTDVDVDGIFAGRHILLVEDMEINREVALALLEPTQLEVDYAVNGKEAVRMFGESPDKYELIFMDIQMPEMDGFEATRCIRALKIPKAVSIPIIAMTANVFKEDVEKCLKAGMDDHVGKPIDFDEVIGKLHYYLPKNN